MKRIASLVLCAALILSLCGCQEPGPDTEPQPGDDLVSAAPDESAEGRTEDGTAAAGTSSAQSETDPPTEPEPTLPYEPDTSPLPYQKGDTVFLGAYEQDNNAANGREPIEWIVLEADHHSALLISRFCLYSSLYKSSASSESFTWDRSSLRDSLNSDFYTRSFSPSEREKILTTTVYPEGNPETGVDGGAVTEDKVFVLSASEAMYYLPDAAARQAESTPLARTWSLMNENFPSTSGKYAAWWLRNPSHGTIGSFVDGKGEIVYFWDSLSLYSVCFRPCIRVSLPLQSVKEDPADALVVEVKHIETGYDTAAGRFSRYISIPKVMIDSSDVQQLNAALAMRWNDRWSPTTTDWEAPNTVDYKYYVNGDVLSLVVWDDAGSNDLKYLVDNIRISTGKHMSSEEVLAEFGITEDRCDALCRREIAAYYDTLLAGSDASMAGMIQMCKEYSLNENFKGYYAQPYLGDVGALCAVISSEWWAGSGHIYYDRGLALTNRSDAQEHAALLFDRIEGEGGTGALAGLAHMADGCRFAAVNTYQRVIFQKGLEATAGLATETLLTIGEIYVFGALPKSLVAELVKGGYNAAAGALADEVLKNPNDLIFDLLKKTDAQRFIRLSELHANYSRDSATEEEAIAYIEEYYSAQIDFATILAAYLFFEAQLADDFGDALRMSADAAFKGVVSFFIGKTTGGISIPSAFEDGVGLRVVAAYLQFLDGKPGAFLEYAKGTGWEPLVRWGYLVESLLVEAVAHTHE